MATYQDTSALVKLVVDEPESAALRAWLTHVDRTPITCDVARTEQLRDVRRHDPTLAPRAREVLDPVIIMRLRTAAFDAAGRLHPSTMHSLDAIHLAGALSLGDELDAFVTYDARLAEGCRCQRRYRRRTLAVASAPGSGTPAANHKRWPGSPGRHRTHGKRS